MGESLFSQWRCGDGGCCKGPECSIRYVDVLKLALDASVSDPESLEAWRGLVPSVRHPESLGAKFGLAPWVGIHSFAFVCDQGRMAASACPRATPRPAEPRGVSPGS